MTICVPIRWRLTLWNTGFMVLILIVAGVGLFVGLRLALYQNFTEQVMAQARLAATTVVDNPTGLALPAGAEIPGEGDEQFVRLIGLDGSLVAGPADSMRLAPVDPGTLARVRKGHDTISTQPTHDGTLVVASLPVRDDAHAVVGILQVAVSRDDVDEFLRTLSVGLLLAVPLIVLAAAGGGYLLAGRALRPVAEITSLAATMDGHNLSARLALPLPDDELGRLATTFDAMLDRIESAAAQQKRFTADVAHELRTPLAILQGQVDIARARTRSVAEYQAMIAAVDDDLGRLRRLVDTLFRLARADQDGIPVSASPFDLAETVEAIGEQYAPIAQAGGIMMVMETTSTPVTLDEDLMVQILVNLIDNALAHTPAGGSVALGCRMEGQEAVAWVHDTGIGIAADHLPHLFDRFYRVDAGRDRQHGGAGLGLAITKGIIEALNGFIAVESTPGQGTSVTVRVPVSLNSGTLPSEQG